MHRDFRQSENGENKGEYDVAANGNVETGFWKKNWKVRLKLE